MPQLHYLNDPSVEFMFFLAAALFLIIVGLAVSMVLQMRDLDREERERPVDPFRDLEPEVVAKIREAERNIRCKSYEDYAG